MNRNYSTTELARNWSEISAVAMRRPVTLTRHRKAQFVLLSVEDYQALIRRGDSRTVHRTETVSTDMAREIEAAVADFADEPE